MTSMSDRETSIPDDPLPPLEGLLVVDLSTTLPGSQATQFLADSGADVVQIEPPGGSPLRATAAWPVLARGRRSIELDLHTDDGRAVLDGLLTRADVAVATGRPETLDRLGFTAERLAALNPRLVSAEITGWGRSGPWAGLPGYEGLVMARLGMCYAKRLTTSRPGPAFVSVPYASWGAAQTAVHGILAALLERDSSGRGQHVEADLVRGVGMMDTWQWTAELIGLRWPGAYETVDAYTPEGEPQGHMLFPLLVAPTKDGYWLQFAQVEPRLFVSMLEEFGLGHMLTDPEWAGIPRFDDQARKSRLWEIMLAKVGERTLAEWQHAFETNPNLSAEQFRSGTEILAHPQLLHDGRVVVVDDPDRGPVRQPSTLVHAGGRPLTPARTAPMLDEDAAALRALAASARSVPEPGSAGAGLPLDGVTVLELGLMFAAPFGSTQLTDLGARVIKIESLSGDTIRGVLPFPESGGARVMQGKESICVDLSTDEGRAIVHDLARRSDVVLQSFRAGAAARAGVDATTLHALNPDLVYLNAPGYGTSGPYGHKPAYAPSIGAAAGFALTDAPAAMAATTTLAEVKEASRHLNQASAIPSLQADGASALGAASAMLLGLVARARGRAPDELTVTMLGTCTHALADHVVDYAGRPASPAVGPGSYGYSALYRLYEAAEGWIFLAAPADAEWEALVTALGRSAGLTDNRFADPDARRRHDAELAASLAAVFLTRPAAEWERSLGSVGIGCVEAYGGNAELQLQVDPTLAAEYGAESVSPVFQEYLRAGTPIRFSRSATRTPGGCLAGDHTDALLGELGRDSAAIADLRGRKIVR
jgi:crotonobetainyl-CoA:carnitine CoA-transferase CaiB-like acyl-CoA transferase